MSEGFEGSSIRSSEARLVFHARGQLGLGDVLLLEDLLELEGDHALERQHFHLGKDAFPGEEFAEVAAPVGVLRCFCFHRLDRINF